MSRTQFLVLLSVCGVMAMFGGLVSGTLVSAGTANAQEAPARGEEQEVVAEYVHARSFVLVDAKGEKRALLEPNAEGGASFVLYAGDSKERFSVRTDAGSTTVEIPDQRGEPAFLLGIHDEPKQRTAAMLISGANATPVFSVQHRGFKDASKKKLEETFIGITDGQDPRLILGHTGNDMTSLSFFNKKEEHTVKLVSSPAEGQLLYLNDVAGKASATVMAREGLSTIQIKREGYSAQGWASQDGAAWQYSQDKVIRLIEGVVKDAGSVIKMLDEHGNETWRTEPQKK